MIIKREMIYCMIYIKIKVCTASHIRIRLNSRLARFIVHDKFDWKQIHYMSVCVSELRKLFHYVMIISFSLSSDREMTSKKNMATFLRKSLLSTNDLIQRQERYCETSLASRECGVLG